MIIIQSKGRIYSFHEPVVMGIINATPDSFYTGSLHESMDAILEKVSAWCKYGMKVLDIGGQSTRPGSTRIGMQEETDRVTPVIEAIHRAFPDLLLSIDTYQAGVARAAIEAGAHMVNDVSSGEMDQTMIPTVADMRVPYLLMHMQGTPETMQAQPAYTDVTAEVIRWLADKIVACTEAGIHDIWVDPGFGFGKTTEHNFTLLRQLSAFSVLQKPIVAGLSRKSMICKTLGILPVDALNGTTVLNTIALLHGAQVLRVHDVKEACEAVQLVQALGKHSTG
ncbi:MAG TPA: dihydropteroate synthase [Ferruginibacter sp.]|nr:dihydropteroate synthase [Ferruginibacter sp.]